MTLNFLHFHPRLSLYLHILSPVLKDSKSTFIFLKAYLDLNLDISPSGHCVLNNLYGILREFDADEVDYIYSESFATGGIGNAIMNRLLKAAGHHVINV